MCFPAANTAMQNASTAGVYLQGVNSIFSGLNAYSGTRNANDAYDYQAQVADVNASEAERQAADALSRGHAVSAEVRKRGKAIKGAQQAALAKSNVDAGFGSALDILTSTDVGVDVDASQAQQNAAEEAHALRMRAHGSRSDAALLRYRSRSTSPLLAGASALLDGATKVADKWYTHTKEYGS